MAEFGRRFPEREKGLEWAVLLFNALWSLPVCSMYSLKEVPCQFSGVTNYGKVWKKVPGKGERLGVGRVVVQDACVFFRLQYVLTK